MKTNRASELEALRCSACGRLYLAPKLACRCGNMELVPHVVTGRGQLASYTRIHVAPSQFAGEVPYVIAAVDIEGLRVVGRLDADPMADWDIGEAVELIDQDSRGLIFRVVASAANGPGANS